ncbi:alpha/beta fold hydrolase [Ruegeria sp. EL01]|jgi:pimeloyl-ACP methyl ester carboxylesterase|uniref:alpha/beta fold hydrolase n=1 Tax=Ruegeria sp. EL01 TaxID=2107578 RepID=UPI000EA82A13|nr:alpha/beta fold hydrolase [Ruegeria sp. EL01]
MTDLIDEGSGPAIVFLHGAGVDNHLWAPQILSFRDSYRVIVPNLAGHGAVAPLASVEQLATLVHAQLRDRGIDQFAVVGLSLGGMVALELAARWPDKITHLAMIETVPTVTQNRLLRFLGQAAITPLRIIPPRLLSLLPASQLGAESDAAAIYIKNTVAKAKASNIYKVMRAALNYDGRWRLPNLSAPTIVMVGERNKNTHTKAKQMANLLKSAKYLVIPSAGHIANLDKPEFVNAVLADFLWAHPFVVSGTTSKVDGLERGSVAKF